MVDRAVRSAPSGMLARPLLATGHRPEGMDRQAADASERVRFALGGRSWNSGPRIPQG
jgi:hypothetical protein